MAQLDPNIILGAKPVQIDSPVNNLAKMMQLQGLQQEGQMRGLQMQDAQEARTSKNKLAELYANSMGADGQIDRNKLLQGAAQRGLGAQIPGMQKEFAATDEQTGKVGKVKAETEKLQLDQGIKRIEFVSQLLGGVKDQASLDQTRALAQQNGIDLSGLPAQYDPAVIEQRRMQGLQMKDQLEQVWKQKGYDLEVGKFGETQRHNKSTEGLTAQGQQITMRGQNMADSRAREANKAAALSQPFTVAGPDGKDMLVQQNKSTGQLQPVQGFGPKMSEKAPTEFQGKSAAYGSRAEEADKIIRDLEGKYSPAAVNAKGALGNVWGVGGALEAGGNVALSANGQKAEQAMRNFVNAVLRQESGAAIAKDEFDNAKKQYFPQPGDSAGVIKQKADNRRNVIQGFKTNSGKAATGGGATADFGAPGGQFKILSVE